MTSRSYERDFDASQDVWMPILVLKPFGGIADAVAFRHRPSYFNNITVVSVRHLQGVTSI